MESMGLTAPQARSHGLLTREVPDGIVVYDEERNRAHSLNGTAALIWRHCDGKTGVGEMTALLEQVNLPSNEEVVWLALDHLEKANLLQHPLARPAGSAGVSRRSVIRRLGLVGGVAAVLPLVASLSAPAAAKQRSQKGNNGLGNGIDPQPPGDPKPNDLNPDNGPHG